MDSPRLVVTEEIGALELRPTNVDGISQFLPVPQHQVPLLARPLARPLVRHLPHQVVKMEVTKMVPKMENRHPPQPQPQPQPLVQQLAHQVVKMEGTKMEKVRMMISVKDSISVTLMPIDANAPRTQSGKCALANVLVVK